LDHMHLFAVGWSCPPPPAALGGALVTKIHQSSKSPSSKNICSSIRQVLPRQVRPAGLPPALTAKAGSARVLRRCSGPRRPRRSAEENDCSDDGSPRLLGRDPTRPCRRRHRPAPLLDRPACFFSGPPDRPPGAPPPPLPGGAGAPLLVKRPKNPTRYAQLLAAPSRWQGPTTQGGVGSPPARPAFSDLFLCGRGVTTGGAAQYALQKNTGCAATHRGREDFRIFVIAPASPCRRHRPTRQPGPPRSRTRPAPRTAGALRPLRAPSALPPPPPGGPRRVDLSEMVKTERAKGRKIQPGTAARRAPRQAGGRDQDAGRRWEPPSPPRLFRFIFVRKGRYYRRSSAVRPPKKHEMCYRSPRKRGPSDFFFGWRRLIHSKGARTAAASTPIGPRARL
jgi:hypothetical protein